MVIAILLGIAWRVVMEIPGAATQGINFAAKNLLKLARGAIIPCSPGNGLPF